ncbi:MAG: PKD domain-containing protein [Ferruginibacter sp.]|nr:PKD domain-containing protein [Ferruginibacter sp.]
MEFVENKGQWDKNVQYKGDFNSGSFFLENGGFTVLLHNSADLAAVSELGHGDGKQPVTLHSFSYKVKFLGASPFIKSIPEKPVSSYNNYFIGNDREKWAGDCKIYQAITYKDIYPNIDVRYYSDGGKLKYDFIVHPGGNVSSIAMQYSGPELFIKDKELVIKTSIGEIRELYPYSYQFETGVRKEINCKYVVKNNIVTFNVKNYNPKEILIIDPTIIFSTFTKSTADNWGYTATPGPDGTLYAGGIVFADPPQTGYPVSTGAFQTTYGGGVEENSFPGYDIAIFKFSANGSNRIYATYLGGSRNEQPHSMIVDRQGNLVVAGRTFSTNYPVTNTIGPGGGFDIVITKFNAAGSNILGSVRIGGTGDDGVNITPKYQYQGDTSIRRNYGDDARSEVILDAANNIILASCTQSANFPTMGASLNTNAVFGGGRQDGLVLKFNSNLSTYLYGSFFGGSGNDACFVTSISPLTGNLYVAGGTGSNNLPGNKTNVIYNAYQGSVADGFITEIKLDSGIVKTTYAGTSGIDIIYGLKFDRQGFPYIMGTTTGSWPIIAAVFKNPGSSQFISKVKPDLSGYVYSTVFGTGSNVPNISPIAFLVDRCENVYVSGWGGGLNVRFGYSSGTTTGMPEKNPLPRIPAPDGADFYFFVLQKNAASQLFGSHFGQNGGLGDHVDGGTSRFDDNGVIYQALCANCGNDVEFPTTPSAWSRTNGSQGCNEALVKIEMDFAGVGAGLQTAIDGVINDTSGCVPFTVVFKDTLFQGTKFYWDFGDNSPQIITTSFDTSHVYSVPGRYRVRLIAEDLNTCNLRDTAYIIIRAGDNAARLSFKPVKDTPCTSKTYTFINTSGATYPTPGFTPQTFTWDYGDGTPTQTSINGRHTFPGPGTYDITLSLSDTNYCNSPTDTTITLRVYDLVKALFTTPLVGCAPYAAKFRFKAGGAGTDFFWSFGDGTFSTDSTEANPTHYYASPGVYPVRLIVRDTNTCNKVDTSAYFNITVLPKPVAAFTWSPNPPQRNTATQFTNLSTGAVRYLWDFGEEGETSTEVNPKHQFNSTGSFKVTLTAYNQNNCDSTVSVTVTALIDPLLDVPNAFTPGRFGENGFVSVKGYGIGKMDWRIYNRWGQLVFHTNSRKQLWDGTFKGKLQPMDVYAYTLDVVFTDGKKLRKTGDITLLR